MIDAYPKYGLRFSRYLEMLQLHNVWHNLTNNASYNKGFLALVSFLKDVLAILCSCEISGAGARVEGLSFKVPFSR